MENEIKRNFIQTSDGVRLSYPEGGSGRPLVMVPGWSQAASIYERQFDDLCRVAHVFAVDMRGHGESEKPAHGYRIQRLSKDLLDLLDALELVEPDILAHSMGVSVVWCYLSLFAVERPLRRLVLVDEPAAIVARAEWSQEERTQAGSAITTLAALSEFKLKFLAAADPASAAELLGPMFTDAIGENTLRHIARENLKLPRQRAVDLLEDNCLQDWRSVIKDIRQPTLVVSGAGSHISVDSQRWIANTIPGAELEVFPVEEGGKHFMFFENPDRFNARVARFLTA